MEANARRSTKRRAGGATASSPSNFRSDPTERTPRSGLGGRELRDHSFAHRQSRTSRRRHACSSMRLSHKPVNVLVHSIGWWDNTCVSTRTAAVIGMDLEIGARSRVSPPTVPGAGTFPRLCATTSHRSSSRTCVTASRLYVRSRSSRSMTAGFRRDGHVIDVGRTIVGLTRRRRTTETTEVRTTTAVERQRRSEGGGSRAASGSPAPGHTRLRSAGVHAAGTRAARPSPSHHEARAPRRHRNR
jgi:hypothetical protein